MKRIFTLLCLIMISYASDAQRLVFVEEFTQASCPPCETSTPELNATLIANEDKVVQIRYQTSWPGVDPMNADNPTEVQTRVDYYGVTGVPTLKINGRDDNNATFPTLVTQAAIDAQANTPTPIDITLTHTLSEDFKTVDVSVSVTNNGTTPYAGNMLRVALVEEVINWATPPGSTSILDYEYVMKRFITGAAGMALPEIAAGETWENSWTGEASPRVVYNFNELAVVAWVQNDNTRAVDNAAVSHAVEQTEFTNVNLTSGVQVSSDLCDYSYVGEATVTNNGDLAASGLTVDLFVNGEATQTISITEELAPGANTSVSFEEITLPAGLSVIGYELGAAKDIATNDNFTPLSGVGKAGDSVAAIENGFEADAIGARPFGTLVDVPFDRLNFIVIDQNGLQAGNSLGAFGQSSSSMMVNFFQWQIPELNPNGSMIIVDQYTVPEGGANVSFDHAYTPWSGSNDQLKVEVSTDCGETFTEVWSDSGASMATAPELNQNQQFFVPTTDQWRSNTADLSAFAGETILVRFAVVSGWGDMLYLDNISVNMSTGLNELADGESINVYPNPAQSTATIDMVIEQASVVNIRVMDMVGKVVATQNLGKNLSGSISHTLDVSSFENGTYLVYVKIGEREAVQRISVIH